MDAPRDRVIRQQAETIGQQREVIERQHAHIERLQEQVRVLGVRIERLEQGKGKPKGMAGNKLEPSKPPKEKAPRKPRKEAFVRLRSEPTHRVVHALERCEACQTTLTHGRVKRTREVIEVALSPATVTEHVFMERRCAHCGRVYVPHSDVLTGVAVGKSRVGVGLHSLIAVLREVGRLPIGTIGWYLRTFHSLSLSMGEIVGVLSRVADRAGAELEEIRHRLRASSWLCADETGWRENGTNGYVWTFSTPQQRYYLRAGRDKGVVERELVDFGGVLVSDFYAAYNVYLGEHQRCWTHLLRDIHELTELYLEDTKLDEWAHKVHSIYEQAKVYKALETHDERHRLNTRLYFEGQLLKVCEPYLEDKQWVQHTLCKRIHHYIKELFVFVGEPGVPPDNNGAERSLRPLVTQRKISGGTRSQLGTSIKLTLASVFGTWQAQGLNPFLQCRSLLSAPHP